MRKLLIVLTVGLFCFSSQNVLSQVKAPDPSRTAVIEARLMRDSAGCPCAVDLWLVSTTDTIQGFELVLQWDRPHQIQFVRGAASASKPTSAADSLTALLKPTDPKTQMPIDRRNSLLSKWEFVEARSTDGLSTKILGVAKLFGQDEPSPILPGASGSLMRIPFSVNKTAAVEETGAVTLNFDGANTRFSTPMGVLFGPLTLKPLAITPRDCNK